MEDKIILVTGASSDIGCEYIKSLEKDGKAITILALYNSNITAIRDLQEHCKAVTIHPYQCDLSDLDAVRMLAIQLKNQWQYVTNILHLPAGKFEYKKLKAFSPENLIREMNIQVNSFVEIAKVFLPLMAKQRFGRVVVMLSSCTLGTPPKFLSEYVTVKYALLGFMKSLAAEYGGKGISINGISPNMIHTKFIQYIDSRMVEMIEENSAMKRNVSLSEIVKVIEFFMSNDCSYITGSNVNVSGGDYM